VGAHDFDRYFGRLTGALGDPTRRGIYLMIRNADHPVTAAQIARSFTIHPNVARHHLDRLVAEGYLRVSGRPARRPAGAGRPPRAFEATEADVTVSYPSRRLDLLADLLVKVVERLEPEDAGRVAEEVGREYGTQLAADMGLTGAGSLPEALAAVAEAMIGAGIEITADAAESQLVRGHCPFGRTATNHSDIVCRLDYGIVRSLVEAAGEDPERVMITSRRHPGIACSGS
jgi:predicted ArsR family transcriptional regulator